MRITFIVNSKANKLKKILNELNDHFLHTDDFQTKIFQTQYKGHAIELAKEAASSCDYLIAVGGDGTLNEVVNGMMSSNIPTNEYPVLGLLPRGSANDFAKSCNAPETANKLKQLISSKVIRKIDLGKVSREGHPISYFINITGLGLSPLAVQNLDKDSKPLGATVAYFYNILKSFTTYKSSVIKCETDNWTWEGEILQVALANGRYYGDGICVAPDAQLADGQLQVCIFGKLTVWDYLKNLKKLKNGIKIDLDEVFYYTAKEVTISSLSENKSGIETDGEYKGVVPAQISIVPQAIKFLGDG